MFNIVWLGKKKDELLSRVVLRFRETPNSLHVLKACVFYSYT
jgi:hypothetical protein